MNIEKDGGSAFPEVVTDCDYHGPSETRYSNTYSHGGMSLRDWFAGQSIIGRVNVRTSVQDRESLSARAYELADSMLAERSKS